jgi:hypothetical protein
MLKSCFERFRHDDVTFRADIRLALPQNFSRMTMLLSDTKTEISYSYMTSKDYVAITKDVKQLIQHLGTMDTIVFPKDSQELRSQITGNKKFLENFLFA